MLKEKKWKALYEVELRPKYTNYGEVELKLITYHQKSMIQMLNFIHFSANIFFDDAFEPHTDAIGGDKINSFVKQLQDSVDKAAK